MKKKHLNLVLTLTLVLALLLAGCGGNEAENVGGSLSSPDASEPAAATEEKTVTMGVLEGGVYTNTYAGFGCELDSSWTIYPAEQLQQLPENVQEMFEGTDYEGIEINQFTDIMAENVNDLTTFNVLYQKLSLQERLAYALMDEEAIIDTTLTQYDTLVAAYANAGIIVDTMEKTTVTFLGEEHTALYTVSTMQDVPYYILQIYDYNAGAYAVVTTFASFVEDNTQSMLDLFYKLG